MIQYELPQETLNSLKEELGHGGIGIVADRVPCHRNLVSGILNGKVKITEDNEKVVTTIQSVIREWREESEKKAKEMEKSIKKTLS